MNTSTLFTLTSKPLQRAYIACPQAAAANVEFLITDTNGAALSLSALSLSFVAYADDSAGTGIFAQTARTGGVFTDYAQTLTVAGLAARDYYWVLVVENFATDYIFSVYSESGHTTKLATTGIVASGINSAVSGTNGVSGSVYIVGASNGTYSGTITPMVNSNSAGIQLTASNTADAGACRFALWDLTNDRVLAGGVLDIQPVPQTA